MYHAIGPVAARIATAGIGITGEITLAGLNVLWIIVAGATLLFAELAICKLLPRGSQARHVCRPHSNGLGRWPRSQRATACAGEYHP